MNDLGQRIYEERKKNQLSQSDLAEKMNVSAKAVSKWETGEAQPTLENIASLTRIFNVSADYLLYGTRAGSQKKKSHFSYLETQPKTRHVLRISGWVLFSVGIVLDAIGLYSFFSAASSIASNPFGGTPDFPSLFFLMWIGLPLGAVGLICLVFGYMGSIHRYAASENMPVVKDSTNFLLNETRDETTETIKQAAEAFHGGNQGEAGPICPKCNTQNEPGALYCDNCGAALSKRCPQCGENNDPDAKHCRKCGSLLK